MEFWLGLECWKLNLEWRGCCECRGIFEVSAWRDGVMIKGFAFLLFVVNGRGFVGFVSPYRL